MSAHPQHLVSVRYSGDTYMARVNGTGVKASCTMGPEPAAQAAARKFCRGDLFRLHRVTDGIWYLDDLRSEQKP
ncbi:MAG: hypothetical protein KF791_08485 [Verrucomicrobiae bacterium]|nr:hypothetical protein [Verrucomicrobiae bacterium]